MTNSDQRGWDELKYATQDKTSVALMGDTDRIDKDDVHNMLMVAGFTPGIGNIADAADAILYATEGEFGEAAWSAAAMTPFIGQWVSAKRALKAAKKSGEEMVTLYRGVDKWHPGRMVREGNFVGGGEYVGGRSLFHKGVDKKALWVAGDLNYAKGDFGGGFIRNPSSPIPTIILEFEVPKSLVKSGLTKTGQHNKKVLGFFEEGLPKEYLKKVHK